MDVSTNDIGETEASGPAGSTKHVMSNIDITPSVNNGFSVRVSYKPENSGRSSRGDSPVAYCEPDNHVFASAPELMTFLQKELGVEAPGESPASSGGGASDDDGDEGQY